jgi:hypothetical protein
VSGLEGIALGATSNVTADYSIALGSTALVSAINSVAIGRNATIGSDGAESVVIGSGASCNTANTIQLGTANHTVATLGNVNVGKNLNANTLYSAIYSIGSSGTDFTWNHALGDTQEVTLNAATANVTMSGALAGSGTTKKLIIHPYSSNANLIFSTGVWNLANGYYGSSAGINMSINTLSATNGAYILSIEAITAGGQYYARLTQYGS